MYIYNKSICILTSKAGLQWDSLLSRSVLYNHLFQLESFCYCCVSSMSHYLNLLRCNERPLV